MRRLGRVEFKDRLVAYLGGMLAVFVAVEAFLVFSEMLTAAYPGAAYEADPARRLLYGPYAPFFWFEVLVGLAVPFVLLAVPRWRRRVPVVAVASVLAVVGILIHRLNIVLNGLSYATVPYPPGVSIGTAQPQGVTSFALHLFYRRASSSTWWRSACCASAPWCSRWRRGSCRCGRRSRTTEDEAAEAPDGSPQAARLGRRPADAAQLPLRTQRRLTRCDSS